MWVPACKLQVGQHLLRDNYDQRGNSVAITKLELCKQALPIYTLEVAQDHTFLVTSYCVVTHNHFLTPAVGDSFSCLCAQSAATSGFTGWLASLMGEELFSWGTISSVSTAGVVLATATVGGLVALGAIYYFGDGKRADYQVKFNVPKVKKALQATKSCGTSIQKKLLTNMKIYQVDA